MQQRRPEKITNSDQELPYKQKDVEQAFITSENEEKPLIKTLKRNNFPEKRLQEGNPAKK